MEPSVIQRVAKWYETNCDGEWEHGYGLKIETVDNPGWHIEIDLKGTDLEAAPFSTHEDRYQDEREWLRCWKDETIFRAACGPGRLEDALTVFVNWAEGHAGQGH